MPYYSEYFDKKGKPDTQITPIDNNGTNLSDDISPTTSPMGHGQDWKFPQNAGLSPTDAGDLLGPSLDAPPSPERIRQLSKQMRRASHLNQTNIHRTPSSRSSSIRSTNGENPSWEQTLDSLSLARRPSNRSTGSSAPSRDRPESVQGFSKNFFQRLGKSNRDSIAQTSSGSSSLYSAESGPEPAALNAPKTGLFSLRKSSRDESVHRRPRISGPFNFQHVTHTQREHVPNPKRGNHTDLLDETSALGSPDLTRAGDADDYRFPRLSPSPGHGRFDSHDGGPVVIRPTTAPTQAFTPHQLKGQKRSQERLWPSPPPRSTRRPSIPAVPDVPSVPPRGSSRQRSTSIAKDEALNSLSSSNGEGGVASTNFRQARPYSPADALSTAHPSPLPNVYPAGSPSVESDGYFSTDRPISRAVTTPDDSCWPLGPGPAALASPLPDVPEEDEHHGPARKSRLSIASNSSLRGSQSVPALRSMSQAQRRGSGASETLGQMEKTNSHRQGKLRQDSAHDLDAMFFSSNWEDAIDYCYDHEAEASCDYQWERSSLDVNRRNVHQPATMTFLEDELSESQTFHVPQCYSAPLLSSAFDVPALSPVSQTSTSNGPDLATPVSNPVVTNNFSLPRGDRKPQRLEVPKKLRPISVASSFKEAQGFNLSPSLLIPNDYHHQMLLTAAEKQAYNNEDDLIHATFDRVDSEASMAQMLQRASTSTTETNSTRRSDSTGGRHVSGQSNWTTSTRLTTASNTSLNKMAGSWSEASGPSPISQTMDAEVQVSQVEVDDDATPPGSKDTLPEMASLPSKARRALHKTHASESLSKEESTPAQAGDGRVRRPRARTTSVTGTPPVGQYALFPRAYVKPTGEHI
jgi:hypothetical protein